MYITYETRQWSDYKNDEDHDCEMEDCTYDQPPKRLPTRLPKPKSGFMPTKLVRISDMQVVPGSTVNEGYCALSYSWSQSGEIIYDPATGKSKRLDRGKHKIIYPAENVIAETIPAPRSKSLVHFEDIIQRISSDFNIQYIWFDQMCIDQDDKEEKQCEIREMHLVYGNAYCTLVLVPELRVHFLMDRTRERCRREPILSTNSLYSSIHLSEWTTRMWTLEEALLSQRLLFVGRNVHTWWYKLRSQKKMFVSYLCQRPRRVSTHVLYHAHQRRCTKDHDRVFALANIFPYVMDDIIIDYEQPLLDLMVRFYGCLAEKDISILCFKGNRSVIYPEDDRKEEDKEDTIRKYDLPSWTGAAGCHTVGSTNQSNFRNYKITGRSMRVTSTAITNNHFDSNYPSTLSMNDLPPWPTEQGSKLFVSVETSDHGGPKIIEVAWVLDDIRKKEVQEKTLDQACRMFRAVSQIMPIKKENLFWAKDITKYSMFSFSLTEVNLSSPYIILSGIPFKDVDYPSGGGCYPVIQKNGDHYYKAIGTCGIHNGNYFFSDYNNAPEQTFIIQ